MVDDPPLVLLTYANSIFLRSAKSSSICRWVRSSVMSDTRLTLSSMSSSSRSVGSPVLAPGMSEAPESNRSVNEISFDADELTFSICSAFVSKLGMFCNSSANILSSLSELDWMGVLVAPSTAICPARRVRLSLCSSGVFGDRNCSPERVDMIASDSPIPPPSLKENCGCCCCLLRLGLGVLWGEEADVVLGTTISPIFSLAEPGESPASVVVSER
mmetsp:Transcript_33113/g.69694  ORF Transcript_33113/g.69694 Transcript_33113/m.69694 type:complete len:216 (+) Transcript_33113:840-1487(+)